MGWKWNNKSPQDRLDQAKAEGKKALVVISDTPADYKRLTSLLELVQGSKPKD